MRTIVHCVVVLLGVAPPLLAQEPVDYAKHIKPILKARCYTCHGALKQKAKLRLDTVQLMRDGGAIMAGDDMASALIERVTTKDADRRMPPASEGEPLTAAQIELLKRWIRGGAKGIASEKPEPDPREHWAFRTIERPKVPSVKNQAWVRNPIDAFIAAEHEKHGLTPMPEAPLGLLLRRVYLDLIGLPPTREELQAFLRECDSATPQAVYEKVVDRLLVSPHYGERWGRHWMDVWRYSDWYGRRHVPDVWNSAPQIWRWRDWIIKSLNDDKGYDRMVMEMLAADEIAPEDDDALVATGYIVRNWYALNPNQWKRDLVEHTGKAFLGLTLNCAHCHDHKYDPISQEEYFRFRAFFEPLELRQDRIPGEGDPGVFQKYDYSKLRKIVKLGAVRVYDEYLDAKTLMYHGGDERNVMKDRPPVKPAAPAFLGGDRLTIAPVQLPARAYYPAIKEYIIKEELASREHELKKAQDALNKSHSELARLRIETAGAELEAYKGRLLVTLKHHHARVEGALAQAVAKAERRAAFLKAKLRHVESEQEVTQLRKQVETSEGKEKDAALAMIKKLEPQVSVLKNAVEQAEKNLALTDSKFTLLGPIYPKTSSGRRKVLAEWIASKDNPLTARVAVNHLWLRHFDRALVETVFDFGRNGKPPSHPALLDWLASELMSPSKPRDERSDSRGSAPWSMKHLHRLIVTSATYRMQSATNPHNAKRDPDNHRYWRANARRMEAEIVRDSILASAGELDRTIGGVVLENTEDKSKRRGLYFSVYPEDGGHLKFLEIFDAPDPCDCYRRNASVMPQQALALTNHPLLIQSSRALARKLSPGASDADFIVASFEHLLARRPNDQEETSCAEFLRKQVALYRQSNPKELSASPDVELRARESLIRVLYNHNDFITVR